ncbi:MFS transporter [Pseudoclavibacter sp. 13-3]|uniref:MFS transporter n=1 Tax=Pseudoclavibacter sp. 13-3 TaxID=2901228 RepID=UPI001E4D2ACC|nr:MFS transporter [Pseudoclavibacter sp. 13-3]
MNQRTTHEPSPKLHLPDDPPQAVNPSPLADPPAQKGLLGRLALASGVGTALEFYDFALYATATSLVFNKVFFVVDDPWFGTFLGFVTFAVGFLMAPIGAVVFGHLGDRIGRRNTLIATFTLMGGATLLMGLLPSHATIGVAAPLLLLFLRLVHGVARGGEVGGAALIAIEQAPAKHRGLYGSFVTLGSPVGAGLANLSFLLILLLPNEAVIGWAWRIPFLLGGLVLVVGLVTRLHVDETPVFKQLQSERKVAKRPVADVLGHSWGRVLGAAGVMFGFNAFQYVLFTFLLSFGSEPVAQHGLGLARNALVTGTLLGCLGHAIAIAVASVLSDRVGRKPVILTGAIGLALYAFPMFSLFTAGSASEAAAAIVIGLTLAGIMFGPMLTWFAQLFAPAQRYTGIGLGFQIGAALGGGFSPLIANRLLAATGTTVSISIFLVAAMVLSLVCIVVLPEQHASSRADDASQRDGGYNHDL